MLAEAFALGVRADDEIVVHHTGYYTSLLRDLQPKVMESRGEEHLREELAMTGKWVQAQEG
jgi:hypothetical protein